MSLSNSYGTGNPGAQIGNREDLSAGISMLEPLNTPVYSLLPKEKVSNTEYSWLTDKLESPSTTPVAEGAPVTAIADAFADQARLYNNTHKLRRTFGVTTEQEAVDSAGPADFDRALAKKMDEIKRDMEAVVCGTQDRVSTGATRQTRGFSDWIDSAGPDDVPAAYRTPSASIHTSGDFTESKMQTILGSIFAQTGKIKNINCVATIDLRKEINEQFARAESGQTFSKFRVNEDADGTITLMVDVFKSNFGNVTLLDANPDCMPSGVNGLLINPQYASIGNLVPLGWERLPNDGSGERAFMEVIFGTKCKNPLAHGKILALS